MRAPELAGRSWVGTPQSLQDLRGRVVLLDFWTAGCVHCLHVLDDLHALEARFSAELVVIGVHSPKFEAEGSPGAVAHAVARLGVQHPVLDDADRQTWSQYAVRAWPTLCVVDPEGYLVHTVTGEGHGPELTELVQRLVDQHRARGTLRPVLRPRPGSPLHSSTASAGLAALPDGTVLVADPAAGEVRQVAADLRTTLRRHTGFRGPRGVWADAAGAVVADAAGHVLRALDPRTGRTVVLAGTGVPRRPGDPSSGPATAVPLSAPWDLVRDADGALVVAGAGSHQLWRVADGRLEVLAGTGAEQLRDGPAASAYLAQPSALARGADRLWFVDAETSALRWYADGGVGTAVGTGLFDFGDRDGPAPVSYTHLTLPTTERV